MRSGCGEVEEMVGKVKVLLRVLPRVRYTLRVSLPLLLRLLRLLLRLRLLLLLARRPALVFFFLRRLGAC
jgi:hypothetical protein